MISQVMSLINNSLISAGSWFIDVFTKSGVLDLYFSFLFIYLAVKFLLTPIFGKARGSDRARSQKEDNDE